MADNNGNIPLNCDKILFAEDVVGHIFFETLQMRFQASVAAPYREFIYQAFDDTVKTAITDIYKRIMTYYILYNIDHGCLSLDQYVRFANRFQKKCFAEGFDPKAFLYYSVHLAMAASKMVIFLGLQKAGDIAVRFILKGFKDYDMFTGGWDVLHLMAETYVKKKDLVEDSLTPNFEIIRPHDLEVSVSDEEEGSNSDGELQRVQENNYVAEEVNESGLQNAQNLARHLDDNEEQELGNDLKVSECVSRIKSSNNDTDKPTLENVSVERDTSNRKETQISEKEFTVGENQHFQAKVLETDCIASEGRQYADERKLKNDSSIQEDVNETKIDMCGLKMALDKEMESNILQLSSSRTAESVGANDIDTNTVQMETPGTSKDTLINQNSADTSINAYRSSNSPSKCVSNATRDIDTVGGNSNRLFPIAKHCSLEKDRSPKRDHKGFEINRSARVLDVPSVFSNQLSNSPLSHNAYRCSKSETDVSKRTKMEENHLLDD